MNPQWQPIDIDESFTEDIRTWLAEKAMEHNLRYLLAHADDGVIWGRLDGDQLTTSAEAFPDKVNVALRALTLQQARLFAPPGELLVWRTDKNTFAARLISDGPDEPEESFTETHWLWGEGEKSNPHFTLMCEGREGLYHAPPVEHAEGGRIGLVVHHYIEYDEIGQAFISCSRLLDFKKVWEAKWF